MDHGRNRRGRAICPEIQGASVRMNHKQRATLHGIFAHPVSGNIDPRLAYAVLEALGAEVSHGGHGHVVVRLNGHTHGFQDARHALSKEQAMALRKFLEAAGVDPERDYPLDASAA
jgi:hypothetical protein